MRIIEDGFLSKWVIWIVILMGVGICWLASVFSSSWVAVIGLVIGSIGGGAAQARALGIRSFKVPMPPVDSKENDSRGDS